MPFGAIGGIIGGGMSLLGQQSANRANQNIAYGNMKFQEVANQRNEALMREAWARDDTAYQRKAADMKAAGLNPLLAAGGATHSSSPIQVAAPKNTMTYQNAMMPAISMATTVASAISSAINEAKRIEVSKEVASEVSEHNDAMEKIAQDANALNKDQFENQKSQELIKNALEARKVDLEAGRITQQQAQFEEQMLKEAERIAIMRHQANIASNAEERNRLNDAVARAGKILDNKATQWRLDYAKEHDMNYGSQDLTRFQKVMTVVNAVTGFVSKMVDSVVPY